MSDEPHYAFPHQYKSAPGQLTVCLGMTLRDYFAAKAMQSLMWDKDLDLDNRSDVAEVAYAYADEMLKAREA